MLGPNFDLNKLGPNFDVSKLGPDFDVSAWLEKDAQNAKLSTEQDPK